MVGTTQEAAYSAKALNADAGLERRWSYGPQFGEVAHQFLFLIEPGGHASYFNFAFADGDGHARVRRVFDCKLSERGPLAKTPPDTPSR